ncbi:MULTISPECIES: hypothetical protein [Stenotrophomonas]|uniref:hypothetical protein n=1 Tax=Stenotrophomonas TaxID=40323 RepID=UPI00114CA19D|nr:MULTISPECIES: hypothetical protein [Stenotrophomonas]
MKTAIVIADRHPIVLVGICDAIDRNPEFAVSSMSRIWRFPTTACAATITRGDGLKLISNLARHFLRDRRLILIIESGPAIVAELYRAGHLAAWCEKSGDLRGLDEALRAIAVKRGDRLQDLPVYSAIPDAGGTSSAVTLSPREVEVIRLFALGLSVGYIAKRPSRSSEGVSALNMNDMGKLGRRLTRNWCLSGESPLCPVKRQVGCSAFSAHLLGFI